MEKTEPEIAQTQTKDEEEKHEPAEITQEEKVSKRELKRRRKDQEWREKKELKKNAMDNEKKKNKPKSRLVAFENATKQVMDPETGEMVEKKVNRNEKKKVGYMLL